MAREKKVCCLRAGVRGAMPAKLSVSQWVTPASFSVSFSYVCPEPVLVKSSIHFRIVKMEEEEEETVCFRTVRPRVAVGRTGRRLVTVLHETCPLRAEQLPEAAFSESQHRTPAGCENGPCFSSTFLIFVPSLPRQLLRFRTTWEKTLAKQRRRVSAPAQADASGGIVLRKARISFLSAAFPMCVPSLSW
jgi:hypothetical protein